MAKEVHGFGMYGMWGPITDPGEAGFSKRVADELNVNVHGSPYRDYQCADIAAMITQLPDDAIVLVWGTSLGANDCPVVGSYTQHIIHGIWGFQASLFGAKMPVTPNVQFAQLIYSLNPINFGLGAYRWAPGDGFDPAKLHLFRRDLPHPGDYDTGSQNMFLNEMRRVIANAQTS